MFCRIIPYTFEDDTTPDPDKKGLVMLCLKGNAESDPDHILDNIPEDAAEIICAFINDGDEEYLKQLSG